MYNSFFANFDYNTLVSRSIFLTLSGETPGTILASYSNFSCGYFKFKAGIQIFVYVFPIKKQNCFIFGPQKNKSGACWGQKESFLKNGGGGGGGKSNEKPVY